MLLRDKRFTSRYNLVDEIKDKYGEDYTREHVLDYLMGDSWSDNTPYGDYAIHTYESSDKSFKHRLNMCWVLPLVLLTAPLQWVLTGSTGVSTKTKFECWLLKITGHLKET